MTTTRFRATAAATFVPLGPARAVDAIGGPVDEDDARYVRGHQEVGR